MNAYVTMRLCMRLCICVCWYLGIYVSVNIVHLCTYLYIIKVEYHQHRYKNK